MFWMLLIWVALIGIWVSGDPVAWLNAIRHPGRRAGEEAAEPEGGLIPKEN